MSDIKLFRVNSKQVIEISASTVALEKSLQILMEHNLEQFFRIRFLETEYSTGKVHGGRIDTLGLDENYCPVIIEYKRNQNENVINQGLYYLDWLMDHRAEFKEIVTKKLNNTVAEKIDWSAPRLLCIAGDFNKYDGHAIKQIDRNIELIRYRKYNDEFLILELLNSVTAKSSPVGAGRNEQGQVNKTASEHLSSAPENIKEIFESIKSFCMSLGDDVQMNSLKYYFAFRRLKNFNSVEIKHKNINLYLAINPDQIILEEGFSRDVRNVGHWGTGNLEISLTSLIDLEKAKPLIQSSYDQN